MHVDTLWSNVHLITLEGKGWVSSAMACWPAPTAASSTSARRGDGHLQPTTRIDGEGRWISPGLIDCHTHLVYAGNRANRIRAAPAGRQLCRDRPCRGRHRLHRARHPRATLEQLAAESRPRLLAMRAEGVTTIEIKSGYGLTPRRAQAAGGACAGRGMPGQRGDHLPRRTRGSARPRSAGNTDEVCNVMIPAIAAEGSEAVDVFCENIASRRRRRGRSSKQRAPTGWR